jgi:RNA polymerase sigma factor (sigma-70 family)
MTSFASPAPRRCRAPRVFRSAPREEAASEPVESRGLPAEQEHELAARIARGDLSARDALITGNLALAHYFAKRYASSSTHDLELDDLKQAGSIGLVIAADRFNPEAHGTRFSTYAAFYIVAQIRLAVYNTGETIRLPVHVHESGAAAAVRRRVSHADCRKIERPWSADLLAGLVEAEDRDRFRALLRRLKRGQRELLRWYASEYGTRGPSTPSGKARRNRAHAAKRLLGQLRAKLNPQEGSDDV